MELLEIVRQRQDEGRFRHTLGCAETAKHLAARWGANESDAYTAGILHDITKGLSYENQLKLCKKHDIILDNVSKETIPLLHAITGAALARLEFHVSDDIYRAIRYHTTARAGMSLLERIIWLSDLIEPSRDFPEVDKLRELAEIDLDGAVFVGLNHSLAYLLPKRQMIDTSMLEARNWIISLIERNSAK